MTAGTRATAKERQADVQAEARVDVTVIGGGIAGLVAANRLAQLGRTACVLEKGSDEKYFCNSRITGGAIHVCYCDPMRAAHDLRAAIDAATRGTAAADLAAAVAADSGRFIRWLQAEGVAFARGGFEEYKRWVLTPLRPQQPGLVWEGLGSDVMLRRLETNLTERGGRLVRGARAVAAEPAQGNRWVVTTQDGRAVQSRAVVIADGGFQGNPELVARYISAQPARLVQRGAGTGCGDGLLIALSLGAATVGLDRFYGHLLSAESATNAKLWPYPWMDLISAAGVVVNAEGERFTDESKGGVFIARDLARLPDPMSAFAVFDEAIWRGPGATGVVPPNPHLLLAGGRIESAGSIEHLAAILELPPARLVGTVAAHNAAVHSDSGAQLDPPRGGGTYRALPIETPPFHAVRLAAGITYTMGGIAVDGHARVLRADGAAIEGLYAAGTATGGLEGGPNAGYVGGLATSGVTALRAAEHIAESLQASLAPGAVAAPAKPS